MFWSQIATNLRGCGAKPSSLRAQATRNPRSLSGLTPHAVAFAADRPTIGLGAPGSRALEPLARGAARNSTLPITS